MKSEGVVLIALGSPQYAYMAGQMARSIKFHNKDIPIWLLHDGRVIHYLPDVYRRMFVGDTVIDEADRVTLGRLDPGRAKVMLPKYLPFDTNVYFDVDGLALKDVSPLFEIEGEYKTEVVGMGTRDEEINYLFWAEPEMVWDFFQLPEDRIYRSIQSSFAILRKGEWMDDFGRRLKSNFDSFKLDNLKNRWGGTMPDELIFAGTCAQLDYDQGCGQSVVFFGHKIVKESFSEIEAKFYVLSLYGNGGGRNGNPLVKLRYRDWYDRMNRMISRETKTPTLGKVYSMTRAKHANSHK